MQTLCLYEEHRAVIYFGADQRQEDEERNNHTVPIYLLCTHLKGSGQGVGCPETGDESDIQPGFRTPNQLLEVFSVRTSIRTC